MGMSSEARRIAEAAAQADDHIEALQRAFEALSADEIADLAFEYLVRQVRDLKRQRVLAIEREVVTFTPEDEREIQRRIQLSEEQAEARRQREDKEREEAYERDMARGREIQAIIAKYESRLRSTWERELLDSQITLRDGSTTTWGEATIEQHRERYEMHAANARAGIEGAARHERAIKDLQAAGVECLNALVPVA